MSLKRDAKVKVMLINLNRRPSVIGLTRRELAYLYMTPSRTGIHYEKDQCISLAAFARQFKGHEVRLIDAQTLNLSNQALRKEVEAFEPDRIFLSSAPFERWRCYPLTIKHIDNALRLLPGRELTLLGPHGSIVPGYFRGKARIIRGDYEKGKNSPAYELLPMREIRKGRGLFIVNTSRGCPYVCSFCAKTMSSTRYSTRDPAQVVDEIRQINGYGFHEIYLIDEIFNLSEDHIKAVCQQIIDSGIRISWASETRPDYIDATLLRLMRKSGCVHLDLGLESANQDILHNIQKSYSLQDVRKAVRTAKEANIDVNLFTIIGLPGESKKSIAATYRFLKDTNPASISFCVATPYPNTKYYELGVSEGKIDPEWLARGEWEKIAAVKGTIGTRFSPKEVNRLAMDFYLKTMPLLRGRMSLPGLALQKIRTLRNSHDLMNSFSWLRSYLFSKS